MNLRHAVTVLLLAGLPLLAPAAGAAKATPPPASPAEARTQMGAALAHALFLLEMDTAAWAATDVAKPVLQKMAKKIQRKADTAAYIQWKEGEAWRVLFFSVEDGEFRALVDILLETPLTRQSQGTLQEYKVGKGPLLQGQPLVMARALLTAHARFQREFEIYPRPAFNVYLEALPDESFRVTYVPADLVNEQTITGPNVEITVAKGGESAAGIRVLNHVFAELPTGTAKAPPGGHRVYWTEPLPSSADLLRLLLHPELGTVTALSPYARFRAKAGAIPTFLPWTVLLGGPDPDDEPWPTAPPAQPAEPAP